MIKIFNNFNRVYIDYICYKLIVYYLILLTSFSILSLLVSLIFSIVSLIYIFSMLLGGIFDAFMVNIILEEVFVIEYVNVVSITDMSDILDTTDISDYIDYISFEKGVKAEEDKCLLYQYFDEFVRLFRKDSGIKTSIYYGIDNLERGNFNIEQKSISIYEEALKHKVIQLEKLSNWNVNIASDLLGDIVTYKNEIYDLNQYSNELEGEVSSLSGQVDDLVIRLRSEEESRRFLNDYSTILSREIIRLQTERYFLIRNSNIDIIMNFDIRFDPSNIRFNVNS